MTVRLWFLPDLKGREALAGTSRCVDMMSVFGSSPVPSSRMGVELLPGVRPVSANRCRIAGIVVET